MAREAVAVHGVTGCATQLHLGAEAKRTEGIPIGQGFLRSPGSGEPAIRPGVKGVVRFGSEDAEEIGPLRDIVVDAPLLTGGQRAESPKIDAQITKPGPKRVAAVLAREVVVLHVRGSSFLRCIGLPLALVAFLSACHYPEVNEGRTTVVQPADTEYETAAA